MYLDNQKKTYQRSIRMTPLVQGIVNDFEGESFNQKFENLVIYLSKMEKQLESSILEKEESIEKLDNRIAEKKDILVKLNTIEHYVNNIIKSNLEI